MTYFTTRAFFLPLLGLLSIVAPSSASEEVPYRSVKAEPGHLVQPSQIKFSDENLKKIKLPPGYRVSVLAKDLGDPRMMVFDSQGTLYVSRPKKGDILKFQDLDNDGTFEKQTTFLSGYENVHGMAIEGNRLYFVVTTKIYSAPLDGKTAPKLIRDKLSDVGQHKNRSIAIGPDHQLYVSIAANCNSCADPNKELASLQKMNLDGSGMTTFSEGLRDTIGFDWQPGTNTLYGFDHGTDWRGDAIPPEELNEITQGKHYGWPFCWENKKEDPNLIAEPEPSTKAEFCKTTTAPVLTYAAHAAPIAMKFYNADAFPNEKGSAFIAFHGSWNRKNPVGYNVSKVRFKNGKPEKIEDFMTGFLAKDGKSQIGRPAGLAIAPDGALLVSDDSGGVIYRVAYGK